MVRVGLGDGFRVRDRASVRAKGGLGFIYYCRFLLDISLFLRPRHRLKRCLQRCFLYLYPYFCILTLPFLFLKA